MSNVFYFYSLFIYFAVTLNRHQEVCNRPRLRTKTSELLLLLFFFFHRHKFRLQVGYATLTLIWQTNTFSNRSRC